MNDIFQGGKVVGRVGSCVDGQEGGVIQGEMEQVQLAWNQYSPMKIHVT